MDKLSLEPQMRSCYEDFNYEYGFEYYTPDEFKEHIEEKIQECLSKHPGWKDATFKSFTFGIHSTCDHDDDCIYLTLAFDRLESDDEALERVIREEQRIKNEAKRLKEEAQRKLEQEERTRLSKLQRYQELTNEMKALERELKA